jgi:hypothetical protein
LFWVYNPRNFVCEGYSHCERIDNQPTIREWLGDWRVLSTKCPGYVRVSEVWKGPDIKRRKFPNQAWLA